MGTVTNHFKDMNKFFDDPSAMHLPCLVADVSGCEKKRSSSTSFAYHTFNTEYYSVIVFMHILVYVY
jgi:hypothetical protein